MNMIKPLSYNVVKMQNKTLEYIAYLTSLDYSLSH